MSCADNAFVDRSLCEVWRVPNMSNDLAIYFFGALLLVMWRLERLGKQIQAVRDCARPWRLSTSSTERLTQPSAIPRSRRGLPIWAGLPLGGHPPTSQNSLPTKPRNGAR